MVAVMITIAVIVVMMVLPPLVIRPLHPRVRDFAFPFIAVRRLFHGFAQGAALPAAGAGASGEAETIKRHGKTEKDRLFHVMVSCFLESGPGGFTIRY